ncbi:MAG TPA: ABC transporter permease, partial [Dongiaceae bacterium]
ASLSFLGLGIQPPYADCGGMVRDNAQAINFGGMAPMIPAIAIGQLTIGVNLLVDWFLSIHSRAHGEGA